MGTWLRVDSILSLGTQAGYMGRSQSCARNVKLRVPEEPHPTSRGPGERGIGCMSAVSEMATSPGFGMLGSPVPKVRALLRGSSAGLPAAICKMCAHLPAGNGLLTTPTLSRGKFGVGRFHYGMRRSSTAGGKDMPPVESGRGSGSRIRDELRGKAS
jgi:hypothetical protein